MQLTINIKQNVQLNKWCSFKARGQLLFDITQDHTIKMLLVTPKQYCRKW
jgi:hypothetical protein